MLTFFRRIRKGLLGSGEARKYMLYAIGEISLVVLGILIALQINNWNESRKDRIKEIGVLVDVSKNLMRNNDIIRSSLKMIQDFDQFSSRVASTMQEGNPIIGFHVLKTL